MSSKMDEQQPIKSQLFQAGTGFGNVVLNFRNIPEDEFEMYAKAFHRSGQFLAEQMLSSSGYNDLAACPIIFLYRHSLELYLKTIVRVGKTLFELTEDTQLITNKELTRHELSKFFPILKQIFKKVGWDGDFDIEGFTLFEQLEKLLNDFDSIDKGSYTFRYPLDLKEEASVSHHFIFNVPNFCQQMDNLLETLENIAIDLKEKKLQLLEEKNYTKMWQ